MKRFAGLSLAAALGLSLLSTVSAGGAMAAPFGEAARAVQASGIAAEAVQFRGGKAGLAGGGRVGGGRGLAGGGRIGGPGRFAGARYGGGYRGYRGRGYYRGDGGAGLAAGLAGAAIIGGIIAAESERNAYYGDPYYYDEPVYVQPRRVYRPYNRNRTTIPYNAIRDPAGGGLTSGGP